MATKSKSKTKDNKNLIIGICAVVVAVVAIAVAVVLVSNSGLNDGYFVSDGSKYVFSMETSKSDLEEDASMPVKTHIVYTYEGDKVTSMKSYQEYADANTAKAAFDKMKEAASEEEDSTIELNGKYIIISASEETYKNLTADDAKKQVEFLESLKNTNPESSEVETEESESTGEETIEE